MAMVSNRWCAALVLANAAVLCACTSFPWETSGRPSSEESQVWTRARMEKELEIAVSQPGVKVCRQFTVGIGNREWVRGVVVDTVPGKIRIRIEDPGKFSHLENGIELQRGSVVEGVMDSWTPCM